MKSLLLIGLLGVCSLFTTGCATPGYSVQERFSLIGRGWDYEGQQLADDIDHVLLLRPGSRMTFWNVQEE